MVDNYTAAGYLKSFWWIGKWQTSLSSWGGILENNLFQGTWSSEEWKLQIHILELRVIQLALPKLVCGTMPRLWFTSVIMEGWEAELLRKKRTWTCLGQYLMLQPSALYIPGRQTFLAISSWINGLFTQKCSQRFVCDGGQWVWISWCTDYKAFAVEALLSPWDHFSVIFVFPLLLWLLHRITKSKRHSGDSDCTSFAKETVVSLLTDKLWAFPDRLDFVSLGSFFHPALQLLALIGWLLKPMFMILYFLPCSRLESQPPENFKDNKFTFHNMSQFTPIFGV